MTQHNKKFKEDAVAYRLSHPELPTRACAKNLGIGFSTLTKWLSLAKKHEGEVPIRGSGNYSSDLEKENARLARELRDAKDALDVLKKAISILGK
ncbi:transposase [Pectinatus brassicae]|uniref:Transposase n=1 Tax=Pectinatus brassicae TaxID=862415 RepID=A0A840UKU1_9FIRM|nr:transposase [Pectinatus brassicae]MBB5337629.1 transposase [Pectinatus brassicae]